MTPAEAKYLVQKYSFLHLSAQPCKLACIGWEVCCYCTDGVTRYAYSASDVHMLYGSGLIRVK